jgi:hypothetical protein
LKKKTRWRYADKGGAAGKGEVGFNIIILFREKKVWLIT